MKDVHVLEFGCQAPLKFFEHCSACPRFGDDCPDLNLGMEILRGKQKVVYEEVAPGEGVHVNSFKCLTPLYYFEKSRLSCAHAGRCREELLDGKRKIDYSQQTAIQLPARKPAKVAAKKKRATQGMP